MSAPENNGVILYRGPSMLDRAPIVVIATGLSDDSDNTKTGGLIQSWILVADIPPAEALHTGADVSICGDCPHRPRRLAPVTPDMRRREIKRAARAKARGAKSGKSPAVWTALQTRAEDRTCYVGMRAPASIWRAYQRGAYPIVAPALISDIFRGRRVRIGSYGDPAAVPIWVWQTLTARAHRVRTGYTHQWRDYPELAPYCMASADSPAERAAAKLLGFRVFRVREHGAPLLDGEISCPASAESGHVTTCDRCGLCAGTTIGSTRAPDISIFAHGAGANAFGGMSA
jgi:hypothetical protein